MHNVHNVQARFGGERNSAGSQKGGGGCATRLGQEGGGGGHKDPRGWQRYNHERGKWEQRLWGEL